MQAWESLSGSLSDSLLTPEVLLRPSEYINIMNVATCHCGMPAETHFGHLGPLCRACFVDVVQKRCRKALKDAGWLKPGQKVHVVEGREALSVLFKSVVKGLPVELVSQEQAEVIIVGKTADDEAEEFVDQLFAGKIEPRSAAVNLFANISTVELEKYCELEGISDAAKPKSELRTRLDALEKRYPGTYFALQKSQESFRENRKSSE